MKILITIWFLFFTASLLADKISLTGDLSLSTIEPGQKTYLSFSIPKEREEEATRLTVKDEILTDSETFKVLERDTFEEETFIKVRYGLTLYQTGDFLIPPIEFELGTKSYGTEFVPIHGSSTRPETDEQLREAFSALPLPWPWEMILLTLSIGAVAFYLIQQYLKKSSIIPPEAPPAILWNEWLLNELLLLQKDPNLDKFTFLIKNYLKEKNHNPIDCLTSGEIESNFKKNKEVLLFLTILKRCDDSKFSPLPKALNLTELIQASEQIVLQCN